MRNFIVLPLVMICFATVLHSQDLPPTNITVLNNPQPGYLFLAPYSRSHLCILDNSGKPAYSKELGFNSSIANAQLQPNGWLTFYEDRTMSFLVLDSNLIVTDTLKCLGYSTDYHECKVLPNGHYLLLGIDNRFIDMSVKIPGGNPNALVMGFVIQEFDSRHNLVFSWNTFDHFNIDDATEDIDLRDAVIRYVHCNSVDVDNDGNFLLSSRHLDEVTKISRATGNIIWRMGGTKCRNNQFEFIGDTISGFFGFSHQHDCRLMPNGNLLLFDNGDLRQVKFSRAVEYRIDEINKKAYKVWEYRNNPDIFSISMGGVQRFDDGSTLISWGNNEDSLVVTEIKEGGIKSFEMYAFGYSPYIVHRSVFKMDAVTKRVTGSGTQTFNDSKYTTGVILNISSVTGNGEIWVEKHRYTPRNSSFTGSTPCRIHPFRWVISQNNITSVNSTITFNLNQTSEFATPVDLSIYYRQTEGSGQFTELQTTYISQSNQIRANFSGFGEYIICGKREMSTLPVSPEINSMNAQVNGKLSWKRFAEDEVYDVRLATDSNFDNIIFQQTGLAENICDYPNLDNNTEYYWGVKVSNSNCSGNWNEEPWTFTTIISNTTLFSPKNQTNDLNPDDTLKWLQVDGANFYSVQVSETQDFKSKIIDETNLEDVRLIFTGLKYYTRYFWRVKANKDSIASNWSEVWEFKTKLYKTKLIFPPKDTVGTDVSGSLKWEKLFGAEVYHIEISIKSSFAENVIDTSVTINELGYVGLNFYTKYYWRVRGRSSTSNGQWSESWTFTTNLDSPVLSYPPDKTAGVPLTGLISWNPVDSAQFYSFQLSTDSLFGSFIINSKGLKVNSVQFKKLEPECKYYCRVQAQNYFTSGNWSRIYSFTTRTSNYLDPPLLLLPEDNAINLKNEIKLEWDKIDSAERYQLQISLTKNISTTVIDTIIGQLDFNFSNLDYNTQYYWRVKSINSKIQSGWSQIRNFTTQIKSPFLLLPADKATGIPQNGSVVWTLAEGANSYNLQISELSDFSHPVFDEEYITNNRFDYYLLKPETRYFWRIKAFNGKRESEWSEVYSFLTAKILGIGDVSNSDDHLSLKIYPNPVIECLTAILSIPSSGNIKLAVFDQTGKVVENITERYFNAGNHELFWKPLNMVNGVYTIQLITDKRIKTNIFIFNSN